MLRGTFPDADESSPAALLDDYRALLQGTLADADESPRADDLDPAVVDAVRDGAVGALTLEEAAAVLAIDPDKPNATAIAAEARDILLMGMTTAVMDVEAVASAVDTTLEPKEIQQKVEGRFPMTLEEYALLHHTIAAGAR